MIKESKLQGWFAPENRENLERIIERCNIKSVIEIGCFQGLSTIFMARRVKSVTTIDPFKGELPEYSHAKSIFLDNLHFFKVDNVNLLEGTSKEINEKYPDLTADLVYIDGDHAYHSVKEDIGLWKSRARKILCGDDFDESTNNDVVRAVKEILPEVIHSGRFWMKNML